MITKTKEQKTLLCNLESFEKYRDFMSEFFEIFNIVKPNLDVLKNEDNSVH